uniref:Genome polyprotein n=1 Tax=Leucocoprinus tobamovirus A TaxID=2592766 RepID=A0A7G3KGB3_9VIRU|nr:putative MP [Leucocoprinus tobamovirus A]
MQAISAKISKAVHERLTNNKNNKNKILLNQYNSVTIPTLLPAIPRLFVPEIRIDISRANYSNFHHALNTLRYTNTGLLLAGPTGCGKTTFALLKPSYTRRTLIISPTVVNCANVLYEWNTTMPRRAKSNRIPNFTFASPDTKLTNHVTCTAQQYVDCFRRTNSHPHFDLIVLDEYHTLALPVVLTLALLRNVAGPHVYVLASATPPGVKLLGNTKRLDLYHSPSTITDADIRHHTAPLSPNALHNCNRGPVVYLLPNNHVSDTLRDNHRAYTDIQQIDNRTTLWQFTDILRSITHTSTIFITPDVASGITLPMTSLVLFPYTTSIDYDGAVILNRLRPLTTTEHTQAFGRAARVTPTMVYSDPSTTSDDISVSNVYNEATAAIYLAAAHIPLANSSLSSALTAFPRLQTLSAKAANTCLSLPGAPLTNVYYMDHDANLYDFCGGTATTFIQDNVHDLRLYTTPKTMFIAPFFDMTADYDPTTWLPWPQQQEMSSHISTASQRPVTTDLKSLANLTADNFDRFGNDFLTICRDIAAGTEYSRNAHPAKHPYTSMTDDEIIKSKPWDVKKKFGDDLITLLDTLQSRGCITYGVSRTVQRDVQGRYKENGSWKAGKVIQVVTSVYVKSHLGEAVINAGLPCTLNADGAIDRIAMTAEFTRRLTLMLSTLWVFKNCDERVVDLSIYKKYIDSNANSWLASQF